MNLETLKTLKAGDVVFYRKTNWFKSLLKKIKIGSDKENIGVIEEVNNVLYLIILNKGKVFSFPYYQIIGDKNTDYLRIYSPRKQYSRTEKDKLSKAIEDYMYLNKPISPEIDIVGWLNKVRPNTFNKIVDAESVKLGLNKYYKVTYSSIE